MIHSHAPLTAAELTALLVRVFAPARPDMGLAVLVDLPGGARPDTPAWRARRELARGWVASLADCAERPVGEVALFVYANVHTNNADLPAVAWPWPSDAPTPTSSAALVSGDALPFPDLFARFPLLFAPTELSATAPLKLAARQYGLQAATMPGFSTAMLPALRLDYGAVHARVAALAGLLDAHDTARLRFAVDPGPDCELTLDLRFNPAHISSGLLRTPGTAGNLPSGEAYVVPYEGERPGVPSRTRGVLPVQHGDEVVLYTIEANRAVAVRSEGPASAREAARLAREPAYGNLAELGLGVLAGFGVQPIGTVLLDEKLGLHVAFGRSDHFGGSVGAAQFSAPEAVVHIDHVYIPALQPRVRVATADLIHADGHATPLMRNGEYVVVF